MNLCELLWHIDLFKIYFPFFFLLKECFPLLSTKTSIQNQAHIISFIRPMSHIIEFDVVNKVYKRKLDANTFFLVYVRFVFFHLMQSTFPSCIYRFICRKIKLNLQERFRLTHKWQWIEYLQHPFNNVDMYTIFFHIFLCYFSQIEF